MRPCLPAFPDKLNPRLPVITHKQVTACLKPRPRDSHKGDFGTVIVLGGASGMVGAALLAARAALKMGTGRVHAGLLAADAPALDTMQPELMLHDAASALALAQNAPRPVIAAGCGMGTAHAARKLMFDILRTPCPLVLDADALNLVARHADLRDDLAARQSPTVLTPHPGEAARLLGISTETVQAARAEAASRLAQELHCSVVLKGADSLCVGRDGKARVNRTGNPGMSAPGMGDALAGMVAAFIAQGLEADQALMLAVHLHGAAGDALAEQGVRVGMTATEIIEWARWLLNQWQPR